MKRLLVPLVLPLAVAGTLALAMSVKADSPPLLTEYPVPGKPLYIAVEAVGKIWFTLPEQNWIGKLVVTSTTEYQVVTYSVPTAGSYPYDVDCAGGMVWFTERDGNKISVLNPADGTFTEFALSDTITHPTGIDVLTGSPTRIWFAAYSRVGQLVVTDTNDYTFTVYFTSTLQYTQLEDIFIQNGDSVWFTAPGVSRIGNVKPSLPASSAIVLVYTGGGSQPWAIKVDSGGYPWFTDKVGNRIGKFFPQTIADILWYTLPSANSAPDDLAIAQGWVWFSEEQGSRVGQLRMSPPSPKFIREFGLPAGSSPRGVGVDANGCMWIAEWGRERIASWCPPYFRFLYLPLVLRNAQ